MPQGLWRRTLPFSTSTPAWQVLAFLCCPGTHDHGLTSFDLGPQPLDEGLSYLRAGFGAEDLGGPAGEQRQRLSLLRGVRVQTPVSQASGPGSSFVARGAVEGEQRRRESIPSRDLGNSGVDQPRSTWFSCFRASEPRVTSRAGAADAHTSLGGTQSTAIGGGAASTRACSAIGATAPGPSFLPSL